MSLRRAVLAACLALSGCVRLRTDPEPLPPVAPRSESEAPPEARAAAPKADGPLDLVRSVGLALLHVPALRAARAQAAAAVAGVDLADTAYLPRVDLVWQMLRATRNNISGTTFPQGVIPAISGPVVPAAAWTSGWGSNAGVLVSYEPVDFGLRSAQLEAARLVARQAESDVRLARLYVAAGAADAFLAHVAALETLRAARANLERWEVFARVVRTLADRELRPGAEASRADAEAAAARIQLLGAEQAVATSRLTLAEAIGLTELPGVVDAGPLLGLPKEDASPIEPSAHPLLARQTAAAEAARGRVDVLGHAYAPKLNLLVSANGRGSGFEPGGAPDVDDGLVPNRWNWGAGVSLTFSALDVVAIRARQRAEESLERAERARVDQIYLSLKMQAARVGEILETARKIAAQTPVQLGAAVEATTRARTRYDSGLGTITEVADAQRLLAQAEIDDALARLAVWRTLAAAARLRGDLDPFLRIVAGAEKK